MSMSEPIILLILYFPLISPTERIIGGSSAKIKDYPYQASLRFYSRHICGAAIIAPAVAITAAHCLQRQGPYSLQVGTDTIQDESAGEIVHVTRGLVHPEFHNRHEDFDVALLFLERNLTFGEKISAVGLPRRDDAVENGVVGKVSGWGVVVASSQIVSRELMVVEVPVWGNEQCEKVFEDVLSERMFCAGFKDGEKDACQGDSGGPFVVNNVVYGVISFGYGCAEPDAPGVYSNLAKYRDFIEEYAGF